MLAWETQWPHVYHLDKIQRDIPEFRPQITLEDDIPSCVAWMEANGLIEDALSDGTEERIIAAIERLGCAMAQGKQAK